MDIPVGLDNNHVKVEVYDTTDTDMNSVDFKMNESCMNENDEDDDDKILYTQIGVCSIPIDEIFKHIVLSNGADYHSVRNIISMEDDSVLKYSSNDKNPYSL